ncbi:MAG: DinB family protein, partial [Candidatus Limnocylindria bacterium]
MPTLGEVLADELDAEIKKVVATLDRLSDEQWRRTAAAEGWPVGLVAFHIALGLERQAGWIEQALGGGPPHQFSRDATNQMTAAVANAGIVPSKPFVLAGLPVAAARLCALL